MNGPRVAIVLGCLALAPPLAAQDADLHGYLDCRLVARPSERSWTDGGLGKTRFGDGGTTAGCVQAGLVGTWQITPALRALADVQYATPAHDAWSLLEAYLLDFSGDLYDQPASVAFVERLRGEQRFENVDDLIKQMHADVIATRQLLGQ